jgi:hypothetical protein
MAELYCVTVTGADDTTDPEELVRIQEEFPFVEWGVLLSKSSEGRPRFPSREWLGRLAVASNLTGRLNLSGHLCGRWVRDLVQRGEFTFHDDRPELGDLFYRYQLNFHAELMAPHADFHRCLERADCCEFIFQLDNVNGRLYEEAQECTEILVSGLFDTSGGAGVLRDSWLPAIGRRCGYAGGLGPDSLAAELPKILEAARGADWVWVDMETHVRTQMPIGGDFFDLAKVRRCLEIAQPFVQGQS